jgi:hypothetical protein
MINADILQYAGLRIDGRKENEYRRYNKDQYIMITYILYSK